MIVSVTFSVDSVWRAVLEWTDKEGKPQKKIYQMERWKP